MALVTSHNYNLKYEIVLVSYFLGFPHPEVTQEFNTARFSQGERN